MSRVWELVKVGQYTEACTAADEEFAVTGSLLALRNKLFALLSLRRYTEAVSLSREILTHSGSQSQSDWIFLGTGLWLSGNCDNAVDAWRRGCTTKYADAAGGVEAPLALLYASVKLARQDLNNESMSALRSCCTSCKNWPGPIAMFVAGLLGEQGLLSAISTNPVLRQKQMCQAHFYVGVMHLWNGRLSQYYKAMDEARSQGAVCRCKQELYLAEAEAATRAG